MDTATLAPVLAKPGPYATVFLDVSEDAESGRQEHETRVRDACRELSEQGAPAAVVERLRQRLDERPGRPAPVARLVIATPDEIVYDELATTRQDRPVVSWAPLPDLTAWATHRDADVRFVLALVDDAGGQVSLCDSDVPVPAEEITAAGELQYVHQVPVGGWASIAVQRTSENVRRRDAEQVVAEIDRLVRQHRPTVVLIAGDPASCGIARRQLDALAAEVILLPTGQPHDDGGDDALRQAIRGAIFQEVVARRTALAGRLSDGLGRGEGVATGVRDVADALVQGRVETLLFDPEHLGDHELDPAEHPGLAFGAARVEGPVRADQALIAGAVLTEATVVPLPSAALAGAPVAALLRWA